MKTLQFFHHSFTNEAMPCKGGTIISMQGYSRNEDFYLCIPIKGFYYRSANCKRYGSFCYEYFFNGEFLGGGRMDKKERIESLCNAGLKDEAIEYIKGYRLWKETELGGKHIVERKEKARISHFLCDANGKNGHIARQEIRRMINL